MNYDEPETLEKITHYVLTHDLPANKELHEYLSVMMSRCCMIVSIAMTIIVRLRRQDLTEDHMIDEMLGQLDEQVRDAVKDRLKHDNGLIEHLIKMFGGVR